jgi:hypothetical protein
VPSAIFPSRLARRRFFLCSRQPAEDSQSCGCRWTGWQKKGEKSRNESSCAKRLPRREVHYQVCADCANRCCCCRRLTPLALLSLKTGLMPADDRSADAVSSWKQQRLDRLNASHGAFREDGVQVGCMRVIRVPGCSCLLRLMLLRAMFLCNLFCRRYDCMQHAQGDLRFRTASTPKAIRKAEIHCSLLCPPPVQGLSVLECKEYQASELLHGMGPPRLSPLFPFLVLSDTD